LGKGEERGKEKRWNVKEKRGTISNSGTQY